MTIETAISMRLTRNKPLKCCPTCNRPFPSEIIVGGRIRQRVYDFVKDHPEGVTRDEIMRHAYALDREGGPESFNTISVMITHINRILREQNAMMYIAGRTGARSDKYKVHYSGVRK